MENMSLINFIIWVIISIITPVSPTVEKKVEYYIQPVGSVNNQIITHVKTSIEGFYGFKCTILPNQDFPESLLSKSKKRYNANMILNHYKSNKNVIVITDKDISTKRGKNEDYGIIGLGFCPGKTCVVSTVRINKKTSKSIFMERLKKVVIHEVGHNLGLKHCNYDPYCLMNDVRGTVKQIDKEKMQLCNNCKNILNKK